MSDLVGEPGHCRAVSTWEPAAWAQGYEIEQSWGGLTQEELTTSIGPATYIPCLNIGNGVDLAVRARAIKRDAIGQVSERGSFSDWSPTIEFAYVPEPSVALCLLIVVVPVACWRWLRKGRE